MAPIAKKEIREDGLYELFEKLFYDVETLNIQFLHSRFWVGKKRGTVLLLFKDNWARLLSRRGASQAFCLHLSCHDVV